MNESNSSAFVVTRCELLFCVALVLILHNHDSFDSLQRTVLCSAYLLNFCTSVNKVCCRKLLSNHVRGPQLISLLMIMV